MCQKSKSEVYVKDRRKPLLFQGKRLKYPHNYHEIVRNGKIITTPCSDGGTALKLLYGEKNKDGTQPDFTLSHVASDVCHSKAYYTIYHLTFNVEELTPSHFEPFGFSRLELKKYLPVLDIKDTGDPNNPHQIVNTLYIANKGCSLNEDTNEVDADSRKEKGLNNKQLFTSTYGKVDPNFYVIRDENDKVECDKSFACFPMILLAYTIIFIRKLITFLPMKFGEYLLHKKNIVAKIVGNIFFTPFVPLKFSLDLVAILSKVSVLMFVADEKKYGDSYCTLYKHQLIECFNELASDLSLIMKGTRVSPVPDGNEYELIGTWNELNIRSKTIEIDLP